MIIQCPACATRYVVPDTAVGVEGRTVRCAKCRHSWFQDGPELTAPPKKAEATAGTGEAAAPQPEQPASPPPPPAPPPPPPTPVATQPKPPGQELRDAVDRRSPAAQHNPARNVAVSFGMDDGPSGHVAAEAKSGERSEPDPPTVEREDRPLPPPPVADTPGYGALAEDEEHSPFDAEPPFRPRRNPLKMWTSAAAIFAAVAAGTIFAVSYWGLPDWVPVERPTFAAVQPDLQLDFPPEEQERRTLPNGTEFFGASGRVTNIGTETRTLPTILIVLRDARETIVFSYEIPPPQRELAPGETVTINEAVTDIPRRAVFAEFGWKPE